MRRGCCAAVFVVLVGALVAVATPQDDGRTISESPGAVNSYVNS
jgi:hypothetical protein